MQASLDKIENQRKVAVNTMSYAAVAAKGHACKSTKRQTAPENMLKEKKRAKEIMIRVEDPKEAEELKKKSSKDILLTAQAAGVEVTGMCCLPNGNVRFHTRSQNIKDTFQNDAS